MRKVISSFLFLLVMGIAPLASAVNLLKVTLSDGVNTRTSLSGFALSMTATAGANHTLFLLTGPNGTTSTTGTSGATRFFPSGCNPAVVGNCTSTTTGKAGDTFKIQDISSSNRARIEKIDVPSGGTATSGADSVVLKGIRIYALAGGAGKTFTLIYEAEAGTLSTISSSTGNYLATAKIKGQFRLDTTSPIDGNNGSIAATCNSGQSTPCVKLVLQINALTLNGQGSSATGVVTTSVPCASGSTTAPCGTGGFWSPSLLSGDQFLATDSGSVGCGTTCAPVQKGTLTARFSAANQVLTLQNSAGSGLAADTQDGLVDLGVALGEPGINQWLASCSGDQPLLAQGLPPFGNQGRNQDTSTGNFPAKFSLAAANLVPATGGFTMESVVDTKESVLSSSAAAKNDFCIMARIFSSTTRPQLKNIGPFTLSWSDFRVGDFPSINSQLGTLAFSDCTACFRVEIDLLKDGVDAGFLTIYLGTNPGDNYRTGHDRGSFPENFSIDFFSNIDLRVDAEEIIPLGGGVAPKDCCITFASAASNSNYGKLLVKAVRVVLESTPGTTTNNHQVTAVNAVVGGNSSSDQLLIVSPNYAPSCNWPPEDGLIMQVYQTNATTGARTWVETIVDTSVDNCTLKADIDVTQLAGAGEYDVEVLAFASPTAAADAAANNQEFKGGIPLGSGLLILK